MNKQQSGVRPQQDLLAVCHEDSRCMGYTGWRQKGVPSKQNSEISMDDGPVQHYTTLLEDSMCMGYTEWRQKGIYEE